MNFAERLGADETVNAGKEDVVERVRELTGGYGSDVVIEAIGLPSMWEQALKLVRKAELFWSSVDVHLEQKSRLTRKSFTTERLTVRGAFHATPLHFRKALNLIASRTIDVRPLITRKMKLENIREAFDIPMTSKKEIKIAIIP